MTNRLQHICKAYTNAHMHNVAPIPMLHATNPHPTLCVHLGCWAMSTWDHHRGNLSNQNKTLSIISLFCFTFSPSSFVTHPYTLAHTAVELLDLVTLKGITHTHTHTHTQTHTHTHTHTHNSDIMIAPCVAVQF